MTTLRDVARSAGCSHQTVSRVINQHPHVRAETRRRVQAAIDALGFTPDLSAQQLGSRRAARTGAAAAAAVRP